MNLIIWEGQLMTNLWWHWQARPLLRSMGLSPPFRIKTAHTQSTLCLQLSTFILYHLNWIRPLRSLGHRSPTLFWKLRMFKLSTRHSFRVCPLSRLVTRIHGRSRLRISLRTSLWALRTCLGSRLRTLWRVRCTMHLSITISTCITLLSGWSTLVSTLVWWLWPRKEALKQLTTRLHSSRHHSKIRISTGTLRAITLK